MEGIKNAVEPDQLNPDLIKASALQEALGKRKDFNQFMRENGYDGEILDVFDEFSTEKACVWIDPLDGTNDFCKGNLSAVTVLIGLSIDGLPKVGVVHNPFQTNENDGKGMTIFGTQEHGAFRLDYDVKMSKEELSARQPQYFEPFDQKMEVSDEYEVRVAASLSHFNQMMQDVIEKIQPVKICRLGGAGNKVNRIALDEVDSYVQPRPGLSFWDLCAPEAIVRGMGGMCTDFNNKRLIYD